MKANEKRIRALLTMFYSIDSFYSITIGRYSNSLQAEFNPGLVREILNLKFKQLPFDANGYLNFTRGNITITLT